MRRRPALVITQDAGRRSKPPATATDTDRPA